MRLWHYKLIANGLIPSSQLVAQWRELNSIFKKQDNHILINYVYKCTKYDLQGYALLVKKEMERRGFKCNINEAVKEYFRGCPTFGYLWPSFTPFKGYHDNQYLLVCFMNLYEKKIRGQKDFTEERFNKLYDYVNQYFDLRSLGIEKAEERGK